MRSVPLREELSCWQARQEQGAIHHVRRWIIGQVFWINDRIQLRRTSNLRKIQALVELDRMNVFNTTRRDFQTRIDIRYTSRQSESGCKTRCALPPRELL